ncbi:unnamed protein product [Rotaria sp. Silwood2]|nr:unnamed protein product [Rotaria sp. Silwood2]CAF4186780.1 unnamed protein product [Rotaria sp. Silwood2]
MNNIVKQLRIVFYKPIDHDIIGLQQTSLYVSTSSSSLTKYPKNMTIPNYLYITVIRLPNYANSSKDVLDEASHSIYHQ